MMKNTGTGKTEYGFWLQLLHFACRYAVVEAVPGKLHLFHPLQIIPIIRQKARPIISMTWLKALPIISMTWLKALPIIPIARLKALPIMRQNL